MDRPDGDNRHDHGPDDTDGGDRWDRPPGVGDATVEATGKLGEALEWVERARGRLYDFHQMMGHADSLFGEAADLLDAAGHVDPADLVRAEVVGRNVLWGRWTFQIVEEFDDGYHGPVSAVERRIRDELVDGRRHLFEAEMKDERRTAAARHHERRPEDPPGS